MSKQVTKSIIVKAEVNDVYELWSAFENFPHFMNYIKSVTKTGETTSHWVMEGPGGVLIDWHAEKTRDEPNKRIAWNSKDKTGVVTTSGQITFNGLPDGETEITATVQYAVPAGKVGELVATALADPEKRLVEDLRRFKAFAEGRTAVADSALSH